jgi:hypothetical protein
MRFPDPSRPPWESRQLGGCTILAIFDPKSSSPVPGPELTWREGSSVPGQQESRQPVPRLMIGKPQLGFLLAKPHRRQPQRNQASDRTQKENLPLGRVSPVNKPFLGYGQGAKRCGRCERSPLRRRPREREPTRTPVAAVLVALVPAQMAAIAPKRTCRRV